MKTIWLISPYGTIPGESWRNDRFVMMAEALTGEGYKVVWWTSNFSHHFKKFRSSGWVDKEINERFLLRLVPTPGYRRNIGLGRIVRDWAFSARAFRRGRELERPDCILYYESPLSFGFAGQKLARFHGCPVIYDQRDLWPELIEKAVPGWIRPLARLMFRPVYWNRAKIYSGLAAAVALAKPYLDVMLREAPVLRERPNAVIYNGIDIANFRQLMRQSGGDELGFPTKAEHEVWAVFAGSLGPSYDIKALLQAAKMLENSPSNVHLIIVGDGPLRGEIERLIETHPAVPLRYLGKFEPARLAALYRQCDIGLCAYSGRSNVEMPDKFYDYVAAGLPVINSLKGEVRSIIERRKMGLQYEAGDVDGLLRALAAMAADRALRREFAANSYATADEFDQHVQYSKICGIVSCVMKRR
jgi:glycosyltransferase involved in cell wall biosynthesis